MRIRTIKPEFWTSQTMAKVSDLGKLLAVGLLNYADDEGFFWANPILIRSAIFPFEQRFERIADALEELSIVGFVQIGKAADGREVGKVVNFLIHQKIDRAKPSSISSLAVFDGDSTINRRSIDDQSSLEGNGRERKGRERSGDDSPPTTDFLTAFESNPAYEGIDVRREYHRMHAWCGVNRKKPTERRFVNWLNRCEKPLPKPALRGSPNI